MDRRVFWPLELRLRLCFFLASRQATVLAQQAELVSHQTQFDLAGALQHLAKCNQFWPTCLSYTGLKVSNLVLVPLHHQLHER
jgi:hypothetical protein